MLPIPSKLHTCCHVVCNHAAEVALRGSCTGLERRLSGSWPKWMSRPCHGHVMCWVRFCGCQCCVCFSLRLGTHRNKGAKHQGAPKSSIPEGIFSKFIKIHQNSSKFMKSESHQNHIIYHLTEIIKHILQVDLSTSTGFPLHQRGILWPRPRGRFSMLQHSPKNPTVHEMHI